MLRIKALCRLRCCLLAVGGFREGDRSSPYGSLEGLAVISDGWEAWQLSPDGHWHEINAADAATKAAVLSAARYHELFGDDVPPLPDAAFRSGWSSPLV